MTVLRGVFTGLLGTMAFISVVQAADTPEFTLRIKDHKFAPANLTIPADAKVKLIVKNEDATAEEFESVEFNREKVIAGNSQGIVFIGPLKPGTYKFYGEFHQDTAQGTLTVK